jgi:hypothetical protein
MKFYIYPLTLILLTGCASSNFSSEETKTLNSSALYDPPSVTLLEGQEYQFAEGKLVGRGQKFYSQYETTKKMIESFKEK